MRALIEDLLREAKARARWRGYIRREVEEAVREALRDVDSVKLHYLENCVACGVCAPACPYYYVDAKYMPTNKAEELRKIYRKRLTFAGRLLGSLVHASIPKTEGDLDRIAEYSYRCVDCGTCYVYCPFGIDSGVLVSGALRRVATLTGRAPTLLLLLESLERKRAYMKVKPLMDAWEHMIEAIEEELGRSVKRGATAEVLYAPTLLDAVLNPEAAVGGALLLDRMGVSWTLPAEPLGVRPPVARLLGLEREAAEAGRRVYDYARHLGVKMVVVLDGGYPYSWLRFEAPSVTGIKPSFEVLHVVELALRAVRSGVPLRMGAEEATWHSPCHMSRRAGLTREPEEVMKVLTSRYRPLKHRGPESLCCGGGCEIIVTARSVRERVAKALGLEPHDVISGPKEERFLEEAEKAFLAAARRKIEEIRESGARLVVTGCPSCVEAIRIASRAYGLEVEVVHVAEYLRWKL